MVDPADRDALRESWAAVRSDSRAFTRAFYGRLFDANPELRPLFPTDLRDLRVKLAATLESLVYGLDHVSTLLLELTRLGQRHADFGARREHYPLVGAALLAAFGDRLGDKFTDRHAAAWGRVYELVATVMQDAAQGTAASRA